MKSSDNDIVFSEGRTTYRFSFLDWDTTFFKRPCFSLDVKDFYLSEHSTIPNRIHSQLEGCFVTAKIDSSGDCLLLRFLENSGFKYMDSEITLAHMGQNHQARENKPVQVLKLEKNVGLPYNELGSVFNLTRFHLDPHIGHDKADSLWIEYLKNYIPGVDRHMFVAQMDDEIAGVFLANESPDGVFLFYSAVLPQFQKKGVGAALVSSLVETFGHLKILTGTQVKNVGALNFYLKNGFVKIESTKTVIHRW